MPDRITLYSEKLQEAVYSLENKEIYSRVDSKGTLKIEVSRFVHGTYYLHITSGKEGEKKTERTRVLLE